MNLRSLPNRRFMLLTVIVLVAIAGALLVEYSASGPDESNLETPPVSPVETVADRAVPTAIDSHGETPVFDDWRSMLIEPANIDRRESFRLDKSAPLVGRYDRLVREAESGDATAATELAAALSYCASAPRSDENQANLLDYTMQTRQVEGILTPVEDLEAALRDIEQRYAYCKGIGRERILDVYLFERLAAENGSLQAKADAIHYGSGLYYDDVWPALERAYAGDDQRIRAHVRNTTEAAKAGSVSAIYRLGEIFAAGEDIPGEKRLSVVEAAAYRIAGLHLKILTGGDSERYEPRLERAFDSLSPHDARDAIASANEILARQSCCFVYEPPDRPTYRTTDE